MRTRFLAFFLLAFAFAATGAAAATVDPPDTRFHEWQQRLDAIETGVRRAPASDAVVLSRLARELGDLRAEVSAWVDAHPEAGQTMAETAIDAAGGDAVTVQDLATEIGRLRATLSRIRAAAEGGDAGAFFLGRVDVAVTAEVPAAATAEITPAGAAVIESSELRRRDQNALAGALALAPGVTYTRIGSRNESAVYVRGFDMRQVPLFIDGIPIYTPYDGYVDLDRFTTFDVAELRVSKGFTSVLYGANTLGGAINVVSRRPAVLFEAAGGAGYASGAAKNAYLNAGSRMGRWYAQGSVSYLNADTFPLAGGFVPVKTQPAGDRLNAYRHDTKGNAKLAWTPNGTDEYAISYVGQRGEKGNPPYAGRDSLVKPRYWQWPYWNKDSVYLVSNTHAGSGYVRGRAFYDTYDNALYSYDDATYATQVKPSAFRSLYKDRTFGASMEWGHGIGTRQMLRAAAHYKHDGHQDHNLGEPVKNFEGRIVSIGAEDSITLSSKASIVAGLGADWQSTTKASDYQKGKVIDLLANCATNGTSCGNSRGINPQVGLFYSVPSGLLRFTVSRKTRMPSMKDRYSYKLGTAVPNPDLKAEHNLTTEAGYQGALGTKSSFGASIYYSRIQDLIQKFVLSPNLSQLRNIGQASHAGVELDARTRAIPHLELSAGYSFLNRKNISDPKIALVDSPRHKLSFSALFTPVARVQVVASVDGEAGRRTMNEAGTVYDVPSFALVNLKGICTLHRALDLEAGVMNVFDRNYWLMEGYPEAGRTALASLRFRF